MMEIFNNVINAGASKPFKVLHATDTHLCYADLRDGDRKVKLSLDRKKYFPDADNAFDYFKKFAKDNNLPIVYTGDLIDFVSELNLEKVKEFTDDYDCIFSAGNHEFSLYVGEAKEDANYRNQSLLKVQNAFKNDIRASSRVINGVKFVCLDNSYYNFEEEQLSFLIKEVKDGLPIILLLHNPLFEKDLYDRTMSINPCAYLVGVPVDLMQNYPKDRFEQQLPDDITLKTVDYIKNQSLIKGIIAGHLHFNYEGVFGSIPQLVSSCTDFRLIEII